MSKPNTQIFLVRDGCIYRPWFMDGSFSWWLASATGQLNINLFKCRLFSLVRLTRLSEFDPHVGLWANTLSNFYLIFYVNLFLKHFLIICYSLLGLWTSPFSLWVMRSRHRSLSLYPNSAWLIYVWA